MASMLTTGGKKKKEEKKVKRKTRLSFRVNKESELSSTLTSGPKYKRTESRKKSRAKGEAVKRKIEAPKAPYISWENPRGRNKSKKKRRAKEDALYMTYDCRQESIEDQMISPTEEQNQDSARSIHKEPYIQSSDIESFLVSNNSRSLIDHRKGTTKQNVKKYISKQKRKLKLREKKIKEAVAEKRIQILDNLNSLNQSVTKSFKGRRRASESKKARPS